jgi:hypothetical protein
MPAASEAIVIKCVSGDSGVHNCLIGLCAPYTYVLCWLKLVYDWINLHNLFWHDIGRNFETEIARNGKQ